VRTRIALVCLSLGLLLSARAEARRYKVTVDSLPQGATVYLEDRAAGSQGITPRTFQLEPGSYTFILELAGYEPLTRKITVKKNSNFTLTLSKKTGPAAITLTAPTGSDAYGATVKVNGKDAGVVPVTLTLQAGRYLLEASKDAFETWREWVDVQAAEKRDITVSLVRGASGLGSLLVSSNIMGAEVFIDGKRVDTAPALVEKLTPGKRTVEVRAPGYLTKQQEVTVEAGKTTKITVELHPDPKTIEASGGNLQVVTNVKGVEVYVDGKPQGVAPVKVTGLADGSHVVEGRKSGMSSAEQTVSVKKGLITTVKLTLKELPPVRHTGGIRVVSPVLGAAVFIDGQLAGKTPVLRHQLDVGPHFVTVRAAGYDEFVQPVEVKAGKITEVKAALAKASGAPSAATVSTPAKAAEPPPAPVDTRGLSSFGAQLVPPRYFIGDFSLGFAHLAELRASIGFFSFKHVGMDGGIELRTFGQVTEVGLHAKVRFLQKSIFSLGALFSLGGGGGPAGRSTVYSNLGVIASLWFKKIITLTARAYLNFYSDRVCPSSYSPGGEADGCTSPPAFLVLNHTDLRQRVGGARFFLSIVAEFPLTKHLGIFGLLEGAPGQGNRLSYSSPFSSYMPESDPGIYGRVGLSIKY
jgi:hypothetical protein